MKSSRRIVPLHWVAAMLLVGMCGCGLSDYQNRMDAQRKRIQDFDEANLLLDDPIEMAKGDMDGKPVWPFEFFLRLPRGFGSSLRDRTQHLKDFSMYQYSSVDDGVSIFVAAAAVADPMDPRSPELYGKYYPASFRVFIRQTLENFYAAKQTVRLSFREKAQPIKCEFVMTTPYPEPDRPWKVSYTCYLYTDEANKKSPDPVAFEVYLHEEAGKQVCIVVHRPLRLQNAEAANRSIEASLGSLDVSGEASAKRNQFKKAKGS